MLSPTAFPAQIDFSDFHTPKEAAELVGISRRAIYDWIAYGWLRAHRVGGRWFITARDLEYFRQRSRGARGKLMPQLRDWSELWTSYPRISSTDNNRE